MLPSLVSTAVRRDIQARQVQLWHLCDTWHCRFGCPVAPPSRQPAFRCLALKIRGRLDKLRPVYVVKGVDIDDGIPGPLDHACCDRNDATSQTHVKICSFGSEPIARDLGIVGDMQIEAAIWMRGPNGSVLCTYGAPAGADRGRRPGPGPVERHADDSAVAACVYPSIRNCVVHVH